MHYTPFPLFLLIITMCYLYHQRPFIFYGKQNQLFNRPSHIRQFFSYRFGRQQLSVRSSCLPHHHIKKSFRLFSLSAYAYEPWALMLRLYVMANYTDKFILGWMNVTLVGAPKAPPSFVPFEKEIECYRDKIHMHFIPPHDIKGMNPQMVQGSSESQAKNRLVDALPEVGATPDDMIFFSDTDEFPTFETMEALLKHYKFTGIQRMPSTQFYYKFRYEQTISAPWIAPFFIYIKDLHEGLNSLRKYHDNLPTNPHFRGIHISYAFPTLEGYRRKLIWGINHYAKPPYVTYEHIFSHVACGLELYDRVNFIDRHNEFVKYIPPLKDDRFDYLHPDFPAAFDDLDKVDLNKLPRTPRACSNVMDLYKIANQTLQKRKQSPRFVDQSAIIGKMNP